MSDFDYEVGYYREVNRVGILQDKITRLRGDVQELEEGSQSLRENNDTYINRCNALDEEIARLVLDVAVLGGELDAYRKALEEIVCLDDGHENLANAVLCIATEAIGKEGENDNTS